MAVIERRRTNPLAELLSWWDDTELAPLAPAPQIRVEDFIDGDRYVVRADIPGVDPDRDLQVSVDNGRLVIQGERREEERDTYRHEVRYGSFTRSLALPTGIEVADIEAHYEDGVLEVRFPLGEPEDPVHHVPVTRPEN